MKNEIISQSAGHEETGADEQLRTLLSSWEAPAVRALMDERVLRSYAESVRRSGPWRRFVAASIPVPLPVAAMIVALLAAASLTVLDSRDDPVLQPPARVEVPGLPVVVEVPVVETRVLRRTVFVEQPAPVKRPPAPRPEVEIAGFKQTLEGLMDEADYVTLADLRGFQPSQEPTVKIIKRGTGDEN